MKMHYVEFSMALVSQHRNLQRSDILFIGLWYLCACKHCKYMVEFSLLTCSLAESPESCPHWLCPCCPVRMCSWRPRQWTEPERGPGDERGSCPYRVLQQEEAVLGDAAETNQSAWPSAHDPLPKRRNTCKFKCYSSQTTISIDVE